jgi:SAM-dependent methyltransferase
MAAPTKAPVVPARADYGLDAPRTVRSMFTRGAMLFLLGFGLWFMNRAEAPRAGAALFAALGAIGLGYFAVGIIMIWSSRTAKLSMRDRFLDAIPWRGDEKVLDVGCGRGLTLTAAARRLKNGKVTGIDLWDAETLSGNNAGAAMANARAEGVADKVKIENGDGRRLPFQPNSCDVVLSALSIHNFKDATDRTQVLDEMLRVAKPGGIIAVWDLFHAGDYLAHFQQAGAELIRQSGLSLLWCVPGRWFVVRKKA